MWNLGRAAVTSTTTTTEDDDMATIDWDRRGSRVYGRAGTPVERVDSTDRGTDLYRREDSDMSSDRMDNIGARVYGDVR